MAIVIKSNSVALKKISSSLLASLPTSPAIHLDFSGGSYKYKNQDVSLLDVVSTNRASVAGFITESGEYKLSSNNSPRVHYESGVGRGLLAGISIKNLAENPNNPVTQDITITIPANMWLVVQTIGNGNCQVSVNSAGNIIKSGSATSAKAFVYTPATDISNAVVTLTPSDISHFQCYLSAFPTTTPHRFVSNTEVKANDFNFINPVKVTEVFSVRSEFSVVLRRANLTALDDLSAAKITTVGVMQVVEASVTNGFFVASYINQRDNKSGLRINGTNESTLTAATTKGNDTYAFSYKAGVGKLYHNGVLISMSYGRDVSIGRLYLGQGVTWDSQQPHIITEAYIYDRALTDAELSSIYY